MDGMQSAVIFGMDITQSLRYHVESISAQSIEENGRFMIAVSGGSLPKILAEALLPIKDQIDWSKWHLFYADERCVPHSSPDSNHGLVQQTLLNHVPIPAQQIYSIRPDLVDDPVAAAQDYQERLLNVFEDEPVFDLILLGLGPDGHTCSLFPGHPLLQEHQKYIASLTNSPKPPPNRITMTYSVLNQAKVCTFVCAGSGKAKILEEIIKDKKIYPASMVDAVKINWILDDGASSFLTNYEKE